MLFDQCSLLKTIFFANFLGSGGFNNIEFKHFNYVNTFLFRIESCDNCDTQLSLERSYEVNTIKKDRTLLDTYNLYIQYIYLIFE